MASRDASAAPLSDRVGRLTEIGPPPRAAQRLLDTLGREDLDIDQLCAELELLPPIAARVVGIAGSAYFGSPAPVRSVKDAVVRVLGLDLVRNVVLGVVIANALGAWSSRRFDYERYWRSALLCAAFARRVAHYVKQNHPRDVRDWETVDGPDPLSPDTAYLCGLLHNIGLLVLLSIELEGMEACLEMCAAYPDRRLQDVQREMLGTDYREVGVLLVERWRLPPDVGAVIAHMHEADHSGPRWCMSATVGLAARWASATVHGWVGESGDEWRGPPGRRDLEPRPFAVALGLSDEETAALGAGMAALTAEVSALAKVFAQPL